MLLTPNAFVFGSHAQTNVRIVIGLHQIDVKLHGRVGNGQHAQLRAVGARDLDK
jgi:hypothetical protein